MKSEKYNKHIYIFGEVHHKRGKCENFQAASDFIVEQIQENYRINPSRIIDIFIETDYIHKIMEKKEKKENQLEKCQN